MCHGRHRERNLIIGNKAKISDDALNNEMCESAEQSLQQLAYMEAVVADISEGLIIADLDGNVLEMNRAALDLHGYSHLGEAQKHISKYSEDWELAYPDGNKIPVNERPLARVLAGEKFRDFEVRAKNLKTGSEYVILCGGSLVYDSSGEPVLAVLTLRNITEQKKLEEELRSIASFPEENPNPVLRLNHNGCVIYANPAAQVLLCEESPKNTSRSRCDRAERPSTAPRRLRKHAETALSSGQSSQFEFACRNGQVFAFVCVPMADRGYANLYGHDITMRKRAEDDLQRALKRLDKNSAKLAAANKELKKINKRLRLANEELCAEMEMRRQAQEALQQQTNLLAAVTNYTRAHLVYLDRDFNFIWVNPQYAQACGRAPEEFIGHNHFEFYPGEEVQRIFEQVRDTGEPFEVKERPFVFPDHPEWGVTYWDWTLTPVKDTDGTVQWLVFSLFDVTQEVLTRKEIERLRAVAEARVAEMASLLDRERHTAQILRQTLVPVDVPSELYGCKFGVAYRPAMHEEEVGGDFYDVIDLGNGKVSVLIGDVTGKGLSAAVQVAAVRYAVRGYAFLDPRPSLVMALANEAVCRETGIEQPRMLTAFFAILDTRRGTLVYASAGHEPAIAIDRQGVCEELAPTGSALGILPGVTYAEYSLRLDRYERVVMLTDGITEAHSDGSVLFGQEKVIRHLIANRGTSAGDCAKSLIEAATEYAHGKLQDDAAVLVIDITAS